MDDEQPTTHGVAPAQEREYNVKMPSEKIVYFDKLKDETITVRDVDDDEDFVTYAVENDVESMHTEPMQQFLAYLAAGRFVKLGDRRQPHGVTTTNEDIANVFAEAYGYDPRDFRPLELARFLLSERLDETIGLDE
ncbi:hypothetical protein HUG10_21315 (plasmid) [Halorarum halophilum]|uniref:Uncharacterized protein n=1 Tax=Halorarum halophilum TaxID=2743090 RepID=A0A7D5H063_9EURY|nr:hypothetical protein [Halobaculum halophilum]QLG30129.1 hypothetical protein HUG10_21315 [Halobaculum halophilum]